MRQESVTFLEANRHHYDLLVQAQYIKHLDGATREGMLNVIRTEFNPGYLADLWCSECVAEMLRYCYVQYDKWKDAQQPEPATETSLENTSGTTDGIPVSEPNPEPTITPDENAPVEPVPIVETPPVEPPPGPPAAQNQPKPEPARTSKNSKK